MAEIWKDVDGFDGVYQVSNTGMVKNTHRDKLLKLETTKLGYKRVTLQHKPLHNHVFVHQLVAKAFIPNPHHLPFINHKDENPSNNNVDNLEWCTQQYNINYGTRNAKVSAHAKPIKQLTKDHIFIAEYPSVIAASISLHLDFSTLYKCCKGKIKTAYGYVWEYS